MIAAASETLPLSVDGAATWTRSPTGNGVFETRWEPAAGLSPEQIASHKPQVWIDSGRVTDPSNLKDSEYRVEFAEAVGGGFDVKVTRIGTAGSDDISPDPPAFTSGKAIEFDGIAITITGTPSPGDDSFTISPSQRTASPFDVIDRIAEDLETPSRSGAQVTQTVQSGLRDLDSTMGTLISVRSRLGGVLDQTDGIDGRLAEQKVAAQTDRSEAEDLDMVEAVSQFQARQTSYDAALKAYSMVQRLSLFEYIR
jgi:flagellar hook-associated protein 3 FlgL